MVPSNLRNSLRMFSVKTDKMLAITPTPKYQTRNPLNCFRATSVISSWDIIMGHSMQVHTNVVERQCYRLRPGRARIARYRGLARRMDVERRALRKTHANAVILIHMFTCGRNKLDVG